METNGALLYELSQVPANMINARWLQGGLLETSELYHKESCSVYKPHKHNNVTMHANIWLDPCMKHLVSQTYQQLQ